MLLVQNLMTRRAHAFVLICLQLHTFRLVFLHNIHRGIDSKGGRQSDCDIWNRKLVDSS